MLIAVFNTQGVNLQARIGMNSGDVVVRAIGSDLRMDYSAVGRTTHLASRMEQLASPGNILLTPSTPDLVDGFVTVKPLGPVPSKGSSNRWKCTGDGRRPGADPVPIRRPSGSYAIRGPRAGSWNSSARHSGSPVAVTARS